MKYSMKLIAWILVLIAFCGCTATEPPAQVVATTLPVYTLTMRLCEGTGIAVTQLITENVSCLHDYTLQVSQMRCVEGADIVILSGAGLEDFMDDTLTGAKSIVDASEGISLHHAEEHRDHNHAHEADPHIWLSPKYAAEMAKNICNGLMNQFPHHTETFQTNLTSLLQDLQDLQDYGQQQLSTLSCRELITFHDGFCYLADSFDLTVIKAVEEESGAEASAAELIELIQLVDTRHLPAIFTEANGSTAAATIVSAETGVPMFTLDMAISGSDYFTAMYQNIDTLREALQ